MTSVKPLPSEVRYVTGYELRSVDADADLLECTVTTYGNWTDVGSFEERMMPGVFDATLSRHADSVKLVVGHIDDVPAVGTPIEWQKSEKELRAIYRFGSTAECRKAYTEAKEGLYGGVSVGFLPGRKDGDSVWEMVDGVPRVTRYQARLLHVGLVTVPANADALYSVRSLGVPEEIVRATPRLDEAKKRLEALLNRWQ
jgi:HK97 family phage prohead protease